MEVRINNRQKMKQLFPQLAIETELNYYKTSAYTLALCQHAYKLFIGSEVEEKRQLIKLVLSDLKVDGEKIVYKAQKPFDVILKCSDDLLWRPLVDYFRTLMIDAIRLPAEVLF
jgi:hypothetical protein